MTDNVGPLLLYVEDERMILELGVTSFEDSGFAVAGFRSGSEAITALDERGADFRALITDIDLGSGPNGWEVAKYARERHPEMPVVYVSGASANEWPSLGVPGSTILVKPYAPVQLVVAVSTAMLGPEAQTNKVG